LIVRSAVTGIGSNNVIDVGVDDDARIDINQLKTLLKDCLTRKRAVYAVVAIIGSTEHGACDQLDKIISLRDDPEASTFSSFFPLNQSSH
jgi:glutamate/tyrosine decarboxylase-like PLP-dependent enzyme